MPCASQTHNMDAARHRENSREERAGKQATREREARLRSQNRSDIQLLARLAREALQPPTMMFAKPSTHAATADSAGPGSPM